MIPHQIRPISLAVIRNGDRIFVMEAFDAVKNQTFYRPPGGGIEFGETSLEALEREFREELANVRLMGCHENLFTFEARRGHEIVFLYEADFADRKFYQPDAIEAREIINGQEVAFTCRWMEPHQFNEITPLYPDGLARLLEARYTAEARRTPGNT